MSLFTKKKPLVLGNQPLKPIRYILHVGRRFTTTTDKDPKFRYVRYGNKIARRIERRRAIGQRSRIERAITSAREDKAEDAQLASNSHERRRFIEAGRAERRGT